MNIETVDRRSTQTATAQACGYRYSPPAKVWCAKPYSHEGECDSRRPITNAEFGMPDLRVDASDEFDQTRQHIHMERSVCPVPDCKEWPRNVSPAINEFRIQELETQLADEKEKNLTLQNRIAGFEGLADKLANAVDGYAREMAEVLQANVPDWHAALHTLDAWGRSIKAEHPETYVLLYQETDRIRRHIAEKGFLELAVTLPDGVRDAA